MAAKTRDRKPVTLENDLLATLSIGRGRSRRRLSDEERDVLVGMFAHKVGTTPFDIRTLAPAGSFSARLLRHFDDTDISYAVPLFTLVSTAASWLTQNGAHLEVPGVGEIVPTMWTVLLAESGEAKTLASDEVMKCLSLDGESPVSLLPDPGSDAQWIDDVATDPTAFWLQDEAGKFLRKVLTDTRFHRIKPWMLDAYSGKPISNRLKGEKNKLVVERPSFNFLGLSVTSTWKLDIDITSMLDGYCQRMNYQVHRCRAAIRCRQTPMLPFRGCLSLRLPQKILHVPQRKREPNVEHHRQVDDLWAALEVAERARFAHAPQLRNRPARLKPSSFDTATALLSYLPQRAVAAKPAIIEGRMPPRASIRASLSEAICASAVISRATLSGESIERVSVQ